MQKKYWLLIWGINIISFLCQIVQIGTLTPLIALGLDRAQKSPFQIGVVVSACWIAVLLLSHVTPQIINRIGYVVACIASALTGALAILLLSLTEDLFLIFLLNFLTGGCLVIRWIACDTWLVSLTKPSNRGRIIGTHETLMGLAVAIGPLLISGAGIQDKTPYVICAGILFCAAAISIPFAGTSSAPEVPKKHQKPNLLKEIPIPIAAAFISGFAETSASSFLPAYALGFGYVLTLATIMLSLFGLGGSLLQIPIGWLADKSNYLLAHMACCFTAIFCSLLLVTSIHSHFVALTSAFFLGGSIGGMFTLAVMEAGTSAEDASLSTYMAGIAKYYTVGSIAGPIIIGSATEAVSHHSVLFSYIVLFSVFIAFTIGHFRSTTN